MKRLLITAGVLLILGLISIGLLLAFFPWRTCFPHPARAQAEIAMLELALERYKIEYDSYPQGDSRSICQALLGENDRKIVFIEWPKESKDGQLLDPWEHSYRISYEKGEPIIRSLGKDGIVSDDDIVNR